MPRHRRTPSPFPAARRMALAVAAGACLLGSPAMAWGPGAHARITSEAIETLPKGLKPYYKAHKLEIPSLSPEATVAEDAPERRFMADRIVPFPFADFPRTETALLAAQLDSPPGRGCSASPAERWVSCWW